MRLSFVRVWKTSALAFIPELSGTFFFLKPQNLVDTKEDEVKEGTQCVPFVPLS